MESHETIAKLGDSSQGFVICTYILITLYIVGMGYNCWMYLYIRKNYPKTATYRIQGIDCLITCPSQIGIIALMLGSIDKYDIKLICTIATGWHCMHATDCELPLFSYHTVSENILKV